MPDPCAHRDADDNGKCDKCGEAFEDGKDLPDAPVCEHKDENKDHACDNGCGQVLGICEDANKDHACDYGCGKTFGTCEYADKDHICDYGCAQTFGSCEDANKDEKCDYGCGKDFVVVYSKRLKFTSNGDSTCYVSGIGTCVDTDLVIPKVSPEGDRVTAIGDWAFSGCESLTSVVIGDNVTSIGEVAFCECYSLASVVIGNSVKNIGEYAFYGCYKLVEVINHSSLDIQVGSWDYGDVAYYAKEVHTGESKIDRVGDYLFYTYETVHYLLGYVGNDTELTLPDHYKGESYEIYNYAFYNRDDLTSVVIPDSVTSIGDSAFCDCDSLTSMKYRGTEEQWNAIERGSDWDYNTGDYTITYNYDGE